MPDIVVVEVDEVPFPLLPVDLASRTAELATVVEVRVEVGLLLPPPRTLLTDARWCWTQRM